MPSTRNYKVWEMKMDSRKSEEATEQQLQTGSDMDIRGEEKEWSPTNNVEKKCQR